jgi:sigma-B regulation protein RsbU (phosphoserine phosphatase)
MALTLRRHLNGLTIAFGLLVAIGSGVIAFTLVKSRSVSDRLNDAQQAAELVARLDASYLNQETGQRGYVLTGESSFLTPFDDGQDGAKTATDELTPLARQLGIMVQLDKVTGDGQAWIAVARPAITRRQAGDISVVSDEAAANAAKNSFDTLRSDVHKLSLDVSDVVKSSSSSRATWRTLLYFELATLLLAAAALTAALLDAVQRRVRRPLDALLGRISSPGPADDPVEDPPELAAISDAFDRYESRLAARLDEETVAREAIEREATLATQLGAVLAAPLGDFPNGWTFAAGLVPADGVVAGDGYIAELIAPTRVALAVVDIAGHGAVAAVSALRAKELLRAALRAGQPPNRAVAGVSDAFGTPDRFLTAFAAVIDTETGRVLYANAGHPPAFVAHRGGDLELLTRTGPLIGLHGSAWGLGTAYMDEGDRLLVYSDGLSEARDPDRQFLVFEDLVRHLDTTGDDAEMIVKSTVDAVLAFTNGQVNDDVTVVVACRATGSP